MIMFSKIHNHQVELRAQIQDEMRQKLKKKAADKIAVLERRLIQFPSFQTKEISPMQYREREI